MTILAALAMLAAPAGASSAPAAPTSCAAIATESETLGRQLEAAAAGLGASMAGHASEAIAANTARNAVSSASGFLNWAVPGAGTAIDLASKAATNAATRAREGKMAQERATMTTTVEAAASRLAELDQQSQRLGCGTGD